MSQTKLYSMIKGLTKSEILRYSSLMCRHGHPLLVHTSCLAEKLGYRIRAGYLDIETSNFSASFGVVITWCIKEEDGGILEGYLKKEDFENSPSGQYDKRILSECIDAMRQFEKLVVYWGKDKRFDIPFLRTRAVTMGLDFPLYQEKYVNDLYDVVKNKFKFGRNSLFAACSQLGIGSKDTQLSPKTWMDATLGRDEKAIQTILQHNREDVISTEALHQRIRHYAGEPNSSI